MLLLAWSTHYRRDGRPSHAGRTSDTLNGDRLGKPAEYLIERARNADNVPAVKMHKGLVVALVGVMDIHAL